MSVRDLHTRTSAKGLLIVQGMPDQKFDADVGHTDMLCSSCMDAELGMQIDLYKVLTQLESARDLPAAG